MDIAVPRFLYIIIKSLGTGDTGKDVSYEETDFVLIDSMYLVKFVFNG